MERISPRQLILMGIMYVLINTLLSVPTQVVSYASQHAWLSFLIPCLVLAPSLWLLAKVSSRYPDQDLFSAMTGRFPVLGRVLTLVIVLYVFFTIARDLRMLADFTNVVLLQQTPMWVITALLTFTMFLIARGGIEIAARMTELSAPFTILVMLMVPLVMVKDFDYTFLMPFFEFDWKGIGIGSWYTFSYIGEIMVLPFLFSHQTFRFRYGLIGMLGGTFLIMLFVTNEILILGVHIIPRLLYPTYELIREIQITDFLDRLDLPLVSIWFPALIIKAAYSLYLACHGLGVIFPSLSVRAVMPSISFLAYVSSFWFFHSSVELLAFNRVWTLIALIPQILIPLLLFVILRPKAGNSSVEQPRG